uniref:Secreted protein n=1 Tax=Ditylenchus dipsaci TaxID=166011 RepID=A0A915CMP1_9BILA
MASHIFILSGGATSSKGLVTPLFCAWMPPGSSNEEVGASPQVVDDCGCVCFLACFSSAATAVLLQLLSLTPTNRWVIGSGAA